MNTEPTTDPEPTGKAPPPPPTLGIRPRDLMRQYGIGKHGLAILIRKEGHPKPIALGKRSSMFLRAEVDAWLESRVARRDAALPTNNRKVLVRFGRSMGPYPSISEEKQK